MAVNINAQELIDNAKTLKMDDTTIQPNDGKQIYDVPDIVIIKQEVKDSEDSDLGVSAYADSHQNGSPVPKKWDGDENVDVKPKIEFYDDQRASDNHNVIQDSTENDLLVSWSVKYDGEDKFYIPTTNSSENFDNSYDRLYLTKLLYKNEDNASEEHFKTEDRRPYECPVCPKRYVHASKLNDHMLTHNDGNVFRCEVCPRKFRQRVALLRHLESHPGEVPYKCKLCNKHFRFLDNLNAHIKRLHQPKTRLYKCKFCGKRCKKTMLKVHMRSHKGQRPYKCELCKKYFSTTASLKVHITTHAGERPYKCDECGKQYAQLNGLKNHAKTHRKKQLYKCEVCNKKYRTLQNLSYHQNHKTDDDYVKCELCCKRFSSSDLLNQHMETHVIKPYQCEVCLYRFLKPESLEIHMYVHTGATPYTCEVCQQSFRRANHLKNHSLLHVIQKPYTCDICNGCFKGPRNFNMHMKTHTNILNALNSM